MYKGSVFGVNQTNYRYLLNAAQKGSSLYKIVAIGLGMVIVRGGEDNCNHRYFLVIDK